MRNKFKIILILGILFFSVNGVSFAQFIVQPSIGGSLPVQNNPLEPSISVSPDKFYTIEEVLYMEGRSDPKAIVTVLFQKQGAKQVKFTVNADSRGEWVLNEKVYLSAGNWEVRARQQVGNLISDWSNPRVVRSIVTGFNFFGINIRYVFLALFTFVFLAILAAILVYFKKKIRKLQEGLVEKQLRETEERFHKGFAEIRKDLMDQLKDLALNSQGRTLTPEEIDKRDHILRELEDIEKNLEHDISGLGKRY